MRGVERHRWLEIENYHHMFQSSESFAETKHRQGNAGVASRNVDHARRGGGGGSDDDNAT